MADSVYEGMYILDAGRFGRDPEGVSGQIPKMIEAGGGEILVSRLWEERRLAFQINGQRKGAYWLTYFRLDGSKLAAMQRQCRLSDSIMRVLFVKVDPRIVDTLVEHAKAGPTSLRRSGPPAAVAAAAAAAVTAAAAAAADAAAENEDAPQVEAVPEAATEVVPEAATATAEEPKDDPTA